MAMMTPAAPPDAWRHCDFFTIRYLSLTRVIAGRRTDFEQGAHHAFP
jgi:hypothetical protein